MKIYVVICLILLSLLSCNLFKNTRTSIQDSHHLSSTKTDLLLVNEKNWLSQSGSITFLKDTSNSDYAIQLWPKGAFTFSREYGFSGEAEKILITGNAKGSSFAANMSGQVQQDKGKEQVKLSKSDQEVSDLKNKVKTSSPSWKGMLALLALASFVGWVIYRKFY